MKFYEEDIKFLNKNEVFVFTSNKQGFHGAGSAGYASFGKSGNIWRQEGYAEKPHGWLGKWNVKGCAEGFQMGEKGCSYAIPTVESPGKPRSIPLSEIKKSIKSFYAFAISNPNWKFFIAQGIKPGYNGYSPEEMAEAFLFPEIPDNVYFQKAFFDIIFLKKGVDNKRGS